MTERTTKTVRLFALQFGVRHTGHINKAPHTQ
jgi:hypothetical protein